MKCFYRLLAITGLVLALADPIFTKVIRPPKHRILEENNTNSVLLTSKQPVRLKKKDKDRGLESEVSKSITIVKKESLDGMRAKIKIFVAEEIKLFFAGAHIDQEVEDRRNVIIDGHKLFDYIISSPKGEDPEQIVEIKFKNPVVTADISIDKTTLKKHVKSYLRTYIHNFFIKVSQTVERVEDLYNELGQMLGYILDEPVMTDEQLAQMNTPDEEGQERILREIRNQRDRDLMTPSMMSHTILKLDDLKNKKYFDNPKEMFEKLNRSGIEMKYQKKIEERNLKLVATKKDRQLDGGDPEDGAEGKAINADLKENNTRYIHSKKQIYRTNRIDQLDHSRLAYIEKARIKSGKIYFTIGSNKQDMSDIKAEVDIVNTDGLKVEVQFYNDSFSSKMTITVPTKRFIIKHIRNELDEIGKMVQILTQINHLSVWRYCFPHETGYKHQSWVNELIDSELVYKFFRAEFDNVTDGLTQASSYGSEGKIHSEFNGEWGGPAKWRFFDEERPDENMLEGDASFLDFGNAFMVYELACNFRIKNEMISTGVRTYPEESMFNQHYIILKTLMFQVETVTRVNKWTILKDLITPFVTTAFLYPSTTSIPELARPSPDMPQLGIKKASNAKNAPDLEMDDSKVVLYIKLCPVESNQFVDTIWWDGSKFQFASARFYPRYDIDYCYVKVRQDLTDSLPEGEEGGGGEERMLFNHTVSIGGLV